MLRETKFPVSKQDQFIYFVFRCPINSFVVFLGTFFFVINVKGLRPFPPLYEGHEREGLPLCCSVYVAGLQRPMLSYSCFWKSKESSR